MSILKIFKPSFILNGFNTPGTKDSRALAATGVAPDDLVNATVLQLTAPVETSNPNAAKAVLLGGAALAVLLLAMPSKRRR